MMSRLPSYNPEEKKWENGVIIKGETKKRTNSPQSASKS